MAAIDYYGIEDTIRSTLATACGSGINVTAEVAQPMDTRPWVGVYLNERIAPTNQPIAAGTRQRYQLRFSIWCWCWSLDNPRSAAEARDDLIGTVESALMSNRRMGGAVENGVLQGGSFETAKDDKGLHLAGGEIIFLADTTAST